MRRMFSLESLTIIGLVVVTSFFLQTISGLTGEDVLVCCRCTYWPTKIEEIDLPKPNFYSSKSYDSAPSPP
jgi:hypothetical protein